MRITLVGRAMKMAPNTLQRRGLGGSETAQICVARELSRMGHDVTLYCELDDNLERRDSTRVQWRHVDSLRRNHHECDLLIVCRRPDLIEQHWVNAQARVLWVQDFVGGDYPSRAELRHYDEVWCVSAWQQQQWLAQLGGALPTTWVTRNGIAPVDLTDGARPARLEHQLLYVSRPERGLMALVRPGGILDHLPDHQLVVCGYDDRPAHAEEYYAEVRRMCEQHEQVSLLGSLDQHSVRYLMAQSTALMLPTNYAETSCMAAMEALEQLCHVIYAPCTGFGTTGSGALPETMARCGKCVDEAGGYEWNGEEFVRTWARVALEFLGDPQRRQRDRHAMLERDDLWWPPVARSWIKRAEKWLGVTE